MTGLKHEKNQAVKDTIMGRVMGYMQRAETLKKVLDEQANPPAGPKDSGGGGSAAAAAQ